MGNGAFHPTHRTPPGGLATYPQPDVSAAPGPMVAAGLDVQLVERWGDWAKIVCTNGWSAWVDGRQLVSGTPPPRTPAPAVAPGAAPPRAAALLNDRTTVTALVGSALVFFGSVLPWARGGGSSNSFEVPIKFLFDYKASNSGLKIGLLLLALAIASAVVVVRKADDRARLGCGIAAAAVAAIYVIQVQRLLSALPDDPDTPGLFDYVGFGVIVALAGGLVIALAPQIATRIATRIPR
jgi:hypothetical protein